MTVNQHNNYFRLLAAILFSIGLFSSCSSLRTKEYLSDKKGKVGVGFYNVENLFDTIDSPDVRDEDFTPNGKYLWSTQRYSDKLERLSTVIEQIGEGELTDGLAILGLAEIENRSVVEDLISTRKLTPRNYQIVHYDSPDKRGIDVGFIYQPNYFVLESSKPYTLKIEGKDDFFSRDQLLVSGNLLGERCHFIVCHWPSRRGGEKESSYLREAAGKLAKSIIDSIQTAEKGAAKIVLMGDLNDDPKNRSVKEELNTNGKLIELNENQLFNPFEEILDRGVGTLKWRGDWFLFDQILISSNLANNETASLKYHKAEVFNKDFIRQQDDGPYNGYPWRTFAGKKYLEGYSDHFPTYIVLSKEKIK